MKVGSGQNSGNSQRVNPFALSRPSHLDLDVFTKSKKQAQAKRKLQVLLDYMDVAKLHELLKKHEAFEEHRKHEKEKHHHFDHHHVGTKTKDDLLIEALKDRLSLSDGEETMLIETIRERLKQPYDLKDIEPKSTPTTMAPYRLDDVFPLREAEDEVDESDQSPMSYGSDGDRPVFYSALGSMSPPLPFSTASNRPNRFKTPPRIEPLSSDGSGPKAVEPSEIILPPQDLMKTTSNMLLRRTLRRRLEQRYTIYHLD